MTRLDPLPSGLLDILVCPACRGALAINYEAGELVCTNGSCGLSYQIAGGVPVLLPDEARKPKHRG
jgi:uncharacterized protein YbaR (Trm112 family)